MSTMSVDSNRVAIRLCVVKKGRAQRARNYIESDEGQAREDLEKEIRSYLHVDPRDPSSPIIQDAVDNEYFEGKDVANKVVYIAKLKRV